MQRVAGMGSWTEAATEKTSGKVELATPRAAAMGSWTEAAMETKRAVEMGSWTEAAMEMKRAVEQSRKSHHQMLRLSQS